MNQVQRDNFNYWKDILKNSERGSVAYAVAKKEVEYYKNLQRG